MSEVKGRQFDLRLRMFIGLGFAPLVLGLQIVLNNTPAVAQSISASRRFAVPISTRADEKVALLDPTRDPSVLGRPHSVPLPEQYIWTAGDAAALQPGHAKLYYRNRSRKTEPHAFRGWFTLSKVPAHAMLYVAGPRFVKAYLNGKLVLNATANTQSSLGTNVFSADVNSVLRTGSNILAIEVVRGLGTVVSSDSPVIQQLAYGEILVAKIVPATLGQNDQPLAMTNTKWRSETATPQGWQLPEFDDGDWPLVQSLGSIESSPDFFQWNIDAGMYDWPGYMGISPYLRTYSLFASAVTHRSVGLEHVNALTTRFTRELFTVRIPAGTKVDNAPALLLDFGREVSGRILIKSACNCEAQVLASYGESEGEALSGENYLGVNLLRIPPHGIARGPKSGFRYAWIRFVGGASQTALKTIRLEGIAYPVHYEGSFESSDPQLNRIWRTAAYTAHLCMQDGVLDGPKRDRGWWAGDLAITGPVIENLFGDSFLLNQTLARLIPPSGEDVNGIPDYTALWIVTLADLYRHSGNMNALEEERAPLLQLLHQMDNEIGSSGRFVNPNHRWLFVDWSPSLFGYTNEAEEGTELEFVIAYREGASLLKHLGEFTVARQYSERAKALAAQARNQFLDADGVFGDRWQLNALAVVSGVAAPRDYSAIWSHVFRGIGSDDTQTQAITPFFNEILLEAMARMGHRRAALQWMREYWGGMLANGATSFWEAYDLRWPKEHLHRNLQVGASRGYFVSLAHGWSSGPATWLIEQVLGIKATRPGFRTVEVRPELVGLKWAQGSVHTPRGLIRVNANNNRVEITIPRGTEAAVLLARGQWVRNGVAVPVETPEGGERMSSIIRGPGQYTFVRR